MGGGSDSSPYYSPQDKVKTKMSLCKLLTQSKTKVGCFKTNSDEENVAEKMSNINSLHSSQKKSRQILRKNLTRGYSGMNFFGWFHHKCKY